MTTDRSQKIIIAVLAALLVVVSAALVRQTYYSNQPVPQPPSVKNENTNTVVNEYSNPNPGNIPEPPQPGAGHDLIPRSYPADKFPTVTIKWLPKGVSVDTQQISKEMGRTVPSVVLTPDDESGIGSPPENPKFTRVGTISAAYDNNFIGRDVYHIDTSCGFATANCMSTLAMIDPKKHLIVAFGRYPQQTAKTLIYPLETISTVDQKSIIPDLEAPMVITLDKPGFTLNTNAPGQGLASDSTASPIALSSDGTRIYLDETKTETMARLPNGEFIYYDLTIPFYAENRIPSIKWNDGSANIADYDPKRRGGCGSSDVLNIQDTNDYTDRLVVGGKTTNGDDVLIINNASDDKLADLYANWHPYGYDGEKPTMESFVSSRPVFFWYDPFGRLIQWTRVDTQPLAECGKPVVYLYPTETEQVSVKLGNNIEVTKSEPIYANGWKVTAEPNGTLTTADGNVFPYLYWDGNGASYNTPTTGFVVASKDVEATLTEKLTALGLNEKEITDFNEFWVPIVSKSPYARISFVPQDEWSKAAPLAISPAPETVIRVFMDWQPLYAPISIDPQSLPPTPERNGFTAVEWGGLLYKN